MKIGIMGAMPEEVGSIANLLNNPVLRSFGSRDFLTGCFSDKEVIVVYSRCGKVSSASTATTLINHFKVNAIIFTGVAGAVPMHLNVGDVVVGDKCIQHDMDGRPIFPKYEIPLSGVTYFHSSQELVSKARLATERFFSAEFHSAIPKEIREKFNISRPAVHVGTIASGDQFVSCPMKVKNLQKEIDNVLAVEMEGAAVSQVCSEYELPFVVFRTISDKANCDAPTDFQQFITQVASFYASAISCSLIQSL